MTYDDVLAIIQTALTLRPENQKVLVARHQAAEIAILDYIHDFVITQQPFYVRTAHEPSRANVPLDLGWTVAFNDLYYSFTINGFDSLGNPVEIYFLDKQTDRIVVKTLIDATINAIAVPYTESKISHL
jgi:hypothetical protein